MLEIAKVTANSQPIKGGYLLQMEAPQIARTAQPGQFVMIRCGENDEHPLRRPLSIHQQEDDKITLLFDIVGSGTQWLAQRQPSDKLDLLGPLGNGFSISPDSNKLLMIAGGIGLAPLLFLAEESVKRGLEVTLLYGTASTAQLCPYLPKGLDVIYATEDGSTGIKGSVTDLIPDFLKESDQSFACGPIPMYKAMAKMPELKNKPIQISLEVRMGCGLGVCYGCTVKTRNGLKQVCQDGPIFELDDIVWEGLTC